MALEGLIVGVLVLLILAFVALWILGAYNRIIRLENQIDNSWGQIDVQLRRRADLIPNLVETVKGYAAHEKTVLEDVTKARSAVMGATTPEQKMQADNMLTGTLKTLFAVAENYPQLKANENFLRLQEELTHTENNVAFARQHYNDSVTDYNNVVKTFPGVVWANMFNKHARPVLEAPAAAREVPKVSFS
jgi:LemA protein